MLRCRRVCDILKRVHTFAKATIVAVFPSLSLAGLLCAVCVGCLSHPKVKTAPRPEPAYVQSSHKVGSAQTYQARWVSLAKIELDGWADELAWAEAAVEKHFVFPWKQSPAPATEFRALWSDTHFYFHYRVQDADIVVLENPRDAGDVVCEDRVEFFLSRDERMNDYFCVEIDSRGRVFDYRASYYRRFDPNWNFTGLETKASPVFDGYQVEGRIPLENISALGFPALRQGAKVRFGIYRAEFSHDRSGRPVVQRETVHNLGRGGDGPPPIEEWISWVDPKTSEPDFHVPSSTGWLELVK